MCRNIRTLYNFAPPATEEEVRAASLQYVRKISGFNKPSQANASAFEEAVDEVARASVKLLDRLVTSAPGGQGAVRQVAELLLQARGEWKGLIERYFESNETAQRVPRSR